MSPQSGSPRPRLLPGEAVKERFGDESDSISLTSHRVIRTIVDNGRTEAEVIFLDKIDSIQYSRKIEWGYLTAAIVLGVLPFLAGLFFSSSARDTSVPHWMELGGFVLFVGLMIAFLMSRQARISISCPSNSIEVKSDAKTVNELIEFIEKVQAAIIERDPGPKAKAEVE